MNWNDDKGKILLIAALWIVALAVGGYLIYRWLKHQEAVRRIYSEDDAIAKKREEEEDPDEKTFLGRWLYLAGFRSRIAPVVFVSATLIALFAGATLALFATNSGLVKSSIAAAESVPGGIGDLARPILIAGPWIMLILWGMLPWMIVNSRRKKRVMEVEQDLPTTLDLLATMSESGLGFDSALTKVIEAQREHRPLVQELKTFQLEVLGGISRVQCFRRLSHRLQVQSMTIFVSALVQAEQVGAGFSNVLRIQADDVRNRRREEANMLAQALTVKLIFPLVICFLPAIFVVTLGPIFLQFLKLADSVGRTR